MWCGAIIIPLEILYTGADLAQPKMFLDCSCLAVRTCCNQATTFMALIVWGLYWYLWSWQSALLMRNWEGTPSGVGVSFHSGAGRAAGNHRQVGQQKTILEKITGFCNHSPGKSCEGNYQKRSGRTRVLCVGCTHVFILPGWKRAKINILSLS